MLRFWLRLFFGYSLFGSNFVSVLNESPLKIGKNIIENSLGGVKFKNLSEFIKPIEEESIRVESTISEETDIEFIESIKTAIEATAKYCKHKIPLTFFTALDETCLVNQTGKSLKITVVNPITVATMTGGILGNDIFEFQEYSFAWQDSSCNKTHNLEARVMYRNLKYDSFEEALDHPDGLALVIFPIATDGNSPNPKFIQFSNVLKTEINRPGDHATIDSAFTYTWFVNFPFGSIYHTYTMPYFDENTGKITKTIVIQLPSDKEINFISNKQFQGVFGKMAGISGQLSQDNHNLSPMERHKGIVVLYLPA